MKKKDLYHNAHLLVAAVRLLTHQKGMPPSVESLGEILRFSIEECSYLCRKLHEMGVIDIVDGAYGTKLFVKNHLDVEKIPQTTEDISLKDDISKFMDSKKNVNREIESIKAKQDKKQKDLFDKIDKQLKKSLDPK